MNIVCFYHGSDLDGICSAAIVKRQYPDAKLYPVEYKLGVSINDKIQPGDKVFIIDYCLQPFDYMAELNEMVDLVWIDHHDTSITDYETFMEEGRTNRIYGIRDVSKAACELTWEYLFPDDPMPYSVWLLGRYDIWNHDESKSIVPFQFGMKLDYESPDDKDFWDRVFTEQRDSEFIQDIIKNGKTIINYRDKLNKTICDVQAFESKLMGFRCICINRALCGSTVFNSIWDENKHDIMVIFYICKKGAWNVSLYTPKKDINVGKIAKIYGGGGHVSAAGFKCSILPFEIDY